jgi:hypothetical protein
LPQRVEMTLREPETCLRAETLARSTKITSARAIVRRLFSCPTTEPRQRFRSDAALTAIVEFGPEETAAHDRICLLRRPRRLGFDQREGFSAGTPNYPALLHPAR